MSIYASHQHMPPKIWYVFVCRLVGVDNPSAGEESGGIYKRQICNEIHFQMAEQI